MPNKNNVNNVTNNEAAIDWFLRQTLKQKIGRTLICGLVLSLYTSIGVVLASVLELETK